MRFKCKCAFSESILMKIQQSINLYGFPIE